MLAGDFKGEGVESQHRSFGSTKDGYNDGGEPFVHSTFKAFGDGSFFHQYPLQMFDRKLRPMDTLYVGLVATKRPMTDLRREQLIRQSKVMQDGINERLAIGFNEEEAAGALPGFVIGGAASRFAQLDDIAARSAAAAGVAAPAPRPAPTPRAKQLFAIGGVIPTSVESFYTFHWVCFSSQQAWIAQARPDRSAFTLDPNPTRLTGTIMSGVDEVICEEYGYAETRSKKASKHYEDIDKPGDTYDSFIGPSRREFEGMVCAYKIGQVIDSSAKKRDPYTGGPSDTTCAVTTNVCVEFMDWRALRRKFNRNDIGMRVPGASPWTGDRGVGLLSLTTLPLPDRVSIVQQLLPLQAGRGVPNGLGEHGEAPYDDADPSYNTEEEKYTRWIAYLRVHSEALYIERERVNQWRTVNGPTAVRTPGDPEVDFAYELSVLAEIVGSTQDDHRIMHWPTQYEPIVRSQYDTLMAATLDPAAAGPGAGGRTFQEITIGSMGQWDLGHMYQKLFATNAPLNPQLITTLEEVLGKHPRTPDGYFLAPPTWDPSDPDAFWRVHDPSRMGRVNPPEWDDPLFIRFAPGRDRGAPPATRRAEMLNYLYRRDGYGTGPANQMLVPTWMTSHILSTSVQSAWFPTLYEQDPDKNIDVVDDFTIAWRPGKNVGPANDQTPWRRDLHESVRTPYLRDLAAAQYRAYQATFYGVTPKDGLFDHVVALQTQHQMYAAALYSSKVARVQGFGLGYRGRIMKLRRSQYNVWSMANPAQAARMKALWANLMDFNTRMGFNDPPNAIGARTFYEWIHQFEHGAVGAAPAGNDRITALLLAGGGTPAQLRQGYNAADPANSAPRDLFTPRRTELLVPAPAPGAVADAGPLGYASPALREAAAAGDAGDVRTRKLVLRNWRAMYLLDGGAGVSEDDFYDYFAPRTLDEIEAQELRPWTYLGQGRKRARGLDMISAPFATRNDMMDAVHIVGDLGRAVDDDDEPEVGARDGGAGVGVADVVMTPAPAPAPDDWLVEQQRLLEQENLRARARRAQQRRDAGSSSSAQVVRRDPPPPPDRYDPYM
ncbi:MAG: hypothetical protein ACKVI4_14300 [Actinomycetales bacterium]